MDCVHPTCHHAVLTMRQSSVAFYIVGQLILIPASMQTHAVRLLELCAHACIVANMYVCIHIYTYVHTHLNLTKYVNMYIERNVYLYHYMCRIIFTYVNIKRERREREKGVHL